MIKVKFHKKVEKGRKDSFWFEGLVATVSCKGIEVYIRTSANQPRVVFKQNEKEFSGNAARRKARELGYTDRKINLLAEKEMFNSSNSFKIHLGENDNTYNYRMGYADLDMAIKEAKRIIKNKLPQPVATTKKIEAKIKELAAITADEVAEKINEMKFSDSVIKAVRYPRQMLLETIISELEKKV
jgi:hypothetical protein